MKKIFFIILSIFTLNITFGNISSDSIQIMINAGNEAYQQNRFEDAIGFYKSVTDENYESAELFYNLGNSYYKSKNNAEAMLWYERALRLSPSNEDIKHNIAFVNQKLTDKIEILPEIFIVKWWKSICSLNSGKGWAIWSILFVTLLMLCLVLILMTRIPWLRNLAFISLIFATIFAVFSILFAQRQTYYYQKHPEAIVMRSVINAKSTPTDNGTDLFVIHEGLKVKVTDKVSEWIEIQLPNGEKGWVLQEEVEII